MSDPTRPDTPLAPPPWLNLDALVWPELVARLGAFTADVLNHLEVAMPLADRALSMLEAHNAGAWSADSEDVALLVASLTGADDLYRLTKALSACWNGEESVEDWVTASDLETLRARYCSTED